MDRQLKVDNALKYLTNVIPSDFRPQVGLTLGTGLSTLAGRIEQVAAIPYADIPDFPVSTVQSHAGELILGRLGGRNIAALAGRFHLYEGYTPQEVTMPVRVLAGLGAEAFIFSNAAGGLDTTWQAGRVMLITDHINFTGRNPLRGPNVDQWGDRFPEMIRAYDPGLADLARGVAAERGIDMYQGVYVGVMGPSMETPAETRMLRGFGADAVGMSTVLEVIAAAQHGLRVLAFSAISNVNDPDDMQPAPIESVIEYAGRAGDDMAALIQGVLQKM